MPETLIFTTSGGSENLPLGGDEVLVQRTTFDGLAVYIQIASPVRGGASVFLTVAEAEALNDQLVALILDAKAAS